MFFNSDRYYHAWGGIPNRVDLVQKCSPEYPCICKAKDDQHYQPESSYQGTTGSTPNLPTELPGLSFGWNCDVSAGLKAVTNEHSSLRTVDVTSLQINDACTTPRTVSFGGLVTDMNDGVSFYKTWELELPEGNGEYEIEIKAEYHKFPGCVLENYALGEVGNPKVVRRLVLDGRLTLTGHSVDCRPLIWMKLHKVSVANRTLAPILYPSSSNIVWEQEMLLPNATVGDVIINAPTFPEKENDKKVIRPDHSMPVCAMGFLYDQDYCMPARHGGTFTSPNQGFIVSLSDEPCAGNSSTCAASIKHVCQHVRATSMCLSNTESTTREDICPIRVDCGGVQARYVRVTLPGDHRILFLPMDGVALYKTAPTNAKVGDYAAYVLEVPPTQLTYPEYTISEDPKDPVFYSTCYTYTLGKRWRPAGQNGVELAPANWHFNGRCLDCETYLDNQRRHNDTSPESRTVKWTMSPSCRDCRQTKPLNFSTVNETFVWAIDGTGAPSPVGETVTCGPGFYESGGAGNDLGCTACVNQANCAASTANQCSTSSGFTTKTPCTSVTAAGYYLDGDVVKTDPLVPSPVDSGSPSPVDSGSHGGEGNDGPSPSSSTTGTATTTLTWTIPMAPQDRTLPNGNYEFVWTGTHNVYAFNDKEAYDTCDFTRATLVGAVSPVVVRASSQPTGTMYYGCEVSGHCGAGQKIAITIGTGGTSSGPQLAPSPLAPSPLAPPPLSGTIAQRLLFTGVTAAEVCTEEGKRLVREALATVLNVEVAVVVVTKCVDQARRRTRRLLAKYVDAGILLLAFFCWAMLLLLAFFLLTNLVLFLKMLLFQWCGVGIHGAGTGGWGGHEKKRGACGHENVGRRRQCREYHGVDRGGRSGRQRQKRGGDDRARTSGGRRCQWHQWVR